MLFTKHPSGDEPFQFKSDIGTRKHLFLESSFSHPAKLHLGLLQYLIDRYTRPGEVIADENGNGAK